MKLYSSSKLITKKTIAKRESDLAYLPKFINYFKFGSD